MVELNIRSNTVFNVAARAAFRLYVMLYLPSCGIFSRGFYEKKESCFPVLPE